MKYIIATAVVLMLIGAPIGSYLYLKSGFMYRLTTLEELQPKEVDVELKYLLDSLVPDNNMVSLVYMDTGENELAEQQFQAISDKIVDRTFFQTVSVNAASRDMASSYNIDRSFYLIDTAGIIRNTYASDDQTLKDIIRHLSVVIPMPKRRTIQLQRDIEDPKTEMTKGG